MMMSVRRQGRPTSQMDHLTVLKLATEQHHLDLITLAFPNERPVVNVLEHAACIINPKNPATPGITSKAFSTPPLLRGISAGRGNTRSQP